MTQRSFMYVGDHAQVAMHGVNFPRNTPVQVDSEQRKVLFGKLMGNNHFLALPDAEKGTMAGGDKPPAENPLGNVPVHPQPAPAPRQDRQATGHQGRR